MSEGEFLYHGTTTECLKKIVKEGLRPGREVRPVGPRRLCRRGIFLSEKEKTARFYARIRCIRFLAWSKNPGFPAVLRVRRSDLSTFLTKKDWWELDLSTWVVFSDKIPPESIEVFRDGNWRPIT